MATRILIVLAILASPCSAEQMRFDHADNGWIRPGTIYPEGRTTGGQMFVGTSTRAVAPWSPVILGWPSAAPSVDLIFWGAAAPIDVYGVHMGMDALNVITQGTFRPSDYRPDLYDALDNERQVGLGAAPRPASNAVQIVTLSRADIDWFLGFNPPTAWFGLLADGEVAQISMSIVSDPRHLPGDANADGAVNNLDIAAFSNGLTGAFAEQVKNRPIYFADLDLDRDGTVTNLDIAPFTQALAGGGTAVPEPGGLLLALLALCWLMLHRRIS